jgi:hypothetical protein
MSFTKTDRLYRKIAGVGLLLAAVLAGLIPAGGALCLPLPDGRNHIHIGYVLPDGDEAQTMRVTTHPVRKVLQAASAGRANFGERQPVILLADVFTLLLATLPAWGLPASGLSFPDGTETARLRRRAQRPATPPPRAAQFPVSGL